MELWKSNGTAVGTSFVQIFYATPGSSVSTSLTQVGNNVFFLADDGEHGKELWVMPLSAVSVSLDEQIDQLVIMLNTSLSSKSGRRTHWRLGSESARRLIARDNSQGNLTAAQAHLLNFIGRLEQLTATGDVNPEVAAPLIQEPGIS